MTVSTAKRTLTIFLLSPFALLLGAACGGEQGAGGGQEQGAGGGGYKAVNVGNFTDWDANNNAELTQREFTQGAKNVNLFGEWDANNNNVLVEREFRQGLEKPKG